jgi:methionyl-tRNA formyltransferase
VLDTIILLTGPVEQPILASSLLGHNPRLTLRSVATLIDVAALEPKLLKRARLVAFATGVVVPSRVLNQLGYGAYNFHPGSPCFPGLAPAQFAVYQEATEFGATAHIMTERVDDGPIVGVELFRVPTDLPVFGLEVLAYCCLARLFGRLANVLAIQPEPLQALPIRWSGQKSSRRTYAAMCDIPLDISKEDLDRRIKAFDGNHFGINPTINLFGNKFQVLATELSHASYAQPLNDASSMILRTNVKKQDRAA